MPLAYTKTFATPATAMSPTHTAVERSQLALPAELLPAAYAMWRRRQVRVSMAVSVREDAVTTSEGAA